MERHGAEKGGAIPSGEFVPGGGDVVGGRLGRSHKFVCSKLARSAAQQHGCMDAQRMLTNYDAK